MSQHVTVAVIGGSQAGLSMSHYLSANGIDHVVFEKNRTAHSWRTQRWDSFCLVTPNWQCKLPGYDYPGNDPDGFMPREDIVAYVEDYARRIRRRLKENTGVTLLTRSDFGFHLETGDGPYTADAIVLAVGGYHQPNIPRLAQRLPTLDPAIPFVELIETARQLPLARCLSTAATSPDARSPRTCIWTAARPTLSSAALPAARAATGARTRWIGSPTSVDPKTCRWISIRCARRCAKKPTII